MFRMYTLRLTHSSPTKAAKFRIIIYIVRPKKKKKSAFSFRSYVMIWNIVCVSPKLNVITGW